jgi:hypothetical protein
LTEQERSRVFEQDGITTVIEPVPALVFFSVVAQAMIVNVLQRKVAQHVSPGSPGGVRTRSK